MTSNLIDALRAEYVYSVDSGVGTYFEQIDIEGSCPGLEEATETLEQMVRDAAEDPRGDVEGVISTVQSVIDAGFIAALRAEYVDGEGPVVGEFLDGYEVGNILASSQVGYGPGRQPGGKGKPEDAPRNETIGNE